MHLISPLAAGIPIAANGFARLYRRGTSTRATWFADFEASAGDSSGADIPLDSNGSLIAYVNELVQVQVYDSLGELQRDFVDGAQAYAVEVISPAFTGTDYTTGQRATSKSTTAGAVFDLWLSSAGAADWQGLYSGAAKSLQDIFGALFGMFYNVKSPEFDAKGDGTTDDTASIQAAHDAAVAAGGGIVVMPPGVYLIGTTLNWSSGVSLLCIENATLKATFAGNPWIHINASLGVTGQTVFYGLATDSSVVNSDNTITVQHDSADTILFQACRFGLTSNVTGNIIGVQSCANAHIIARDCVATVRGATTSFLTDFRALTTSERVTVDGCDVTVDSSPNPYTGFVLGTAGALLMVSETRVTISNTGGGGVIVKVQTAATIVHISSCAFIGGGGTIYAVKLLQDASVYVGDDNHLVGFPSTGAYLQSATTDVLRDDGSSRLQLRATRIESYVGTTDTVENYYETYVSQSQNAAPPTITMPLIAFYGQVLNLIIWNDQAGNWATPPVLSPSPNAGTDHSTIPNLLSGHCATAKFVAMNKGHVGPRWTQIGEWADTTT